VRFALVLAVVATLLVAGCTTDAVTVPDLPDTTSSGTTGPTAGTIDWRSCSAEAMKIDGGFPANLTASCGSVTVPANWHTAKDGKAVDGKTFNIAVIKIHAKSNTKPAGSILTNPGGPGGSGYDFPVQVAGRMSGLLQRFDIIGFDPRGVKRSEPVKCFSDADLDANFGFQPDPVSDADFQSWVDLNTRMGNDCQSKYGKDLSLFSTWQAAHDIDAIRIALGEDKVNYLGFSYGTLLGAVYAQLFPKNIRAMTLDGAVDPTESYQDAAEGQAMGFERAFADFTTWCKGHASTCAISADPRGAVVNAVNSALTSPVVAKDGRRATAGWVLLSVLASLYTKDAWEAMAEGISDLKQGDPRLMFLIADSYAERNPDGSYSNTTDAFNVISCGEETSPGLSQIRSLQAQWRTKYPLFGTSLAMGLVQCAVWPAAKDPFPTGKADGAPTIIVVGNTGDPATPYESTAKLANMLGVGRVLTWQGEGHTAYLFSDCIKSTVNNYFIDKVIPAQGKVCPPQ
jgi:pimeloyl-ACP methyl ester carboxylesterase